MIEQHPLSDQSSPSEPPGSPYRDGWIATAVFSAAWSVGFSILGIAQYVRYHIHAFDLGIFAQGTWLLSQIKEPFVTVRGLHLFADHSSYILVLLAPIYAVFPSASTLIIVTVLALAASSVLAFAVAKEAGAQQWLAFAVAALFLISPAVEWQVRDVFHPEILVIPLMLATVWLVQRNKDGWAIVATLIALTAKEDVGLLVVPLGLAVVWAFGKRRTGFTIAAAGVAGFLLNFLVLLPAWSPTGELLYSYRYSHLGETPLDIIVGVATSPDVWIDTITDPTKIWYVAALVLAMPLAMLSWRWLLVGLPALAANVLSTHGYQYEIPWHYTAYLIVVVTLAAAFGAAKLPSIGRRWIRTSIVAATVLIPVVIWVAAAPVKVWAEPHTDHARISSMLAIIPADASVSAWTTLVPHLANRQEVYLFPNPFENYYYGYDSADSPDGVRPDYIALRLDSYRDFDAIFTGLVGSGEYTVFYDDHPFRLLRRVP